MANIAIVLGFADLSERFFDDPDAHLTSRTFAILVSCAIWRFLANRSANSQRMRFLLFLTAILFSWFYVGPVFGENRNATSFASMAVLIFAPTMIAAFFIDANDWWNTPVWFCCKIAVELAVIYPAWIFAIALFDAFVVPLGP
jgi:hypothetical protein